MPSSTGGRWKRGDPIGHPRVPGRCAEKCHHDGPVGTQPTDQPRPRQRSTLLSSFKREVPSAPAPCPERLQGAGAPAHPSPGAGVAPPDDRRLEPAAPARGALLRPRRGDQPLRGPRSVDQDAPALEGPWLKGPARVPSKASEPGALRTWPRQPRGRRPGAAPLARLRAQSGVTRMRSRRSGSDGGAWGRLQAPTRCRPCFTVARSGPPAGWASPRRC